MLGQRETIQDFQSRFPILFYSLMVLLTLLMMRLFYLQIFRGNFYRKFSESQSLREDKVPGPRGQLLDRHGKVLVDNRLQLDITLTPQFVKNPKQVIERLAKVSGEAFDQLWRNYERGVKKVPRFAPVTVIENAPWPLVARLETRRDEQLGGVEVRQRILRSYMHKQVGAHLYGYLGQVSKDELEKLKDYSLGDWLGRAGVERVWEKYLRGQDGISYVEVDAHGRRVSRSTEDPELQALLQRNVEPRAGHSLQLTLDEDLQLAASEAMRGKMGAVVAMDVRTGEILAMISYPAFDPTDMTSHGPDLWESFVNNPYGPLRNKAIQDHFPPGSTYKPFTVLAALERNLITPESRLSCPATYRFGNRTYHEHKKDGFGLIGARDAIKVSSDVFMYQLGAKIPINELSKTGSEFGLGRKTGIRLPHEAPGLMPTEEWKQQAFKQPWTPGETLSAAIGQGANLATPLQMAVAYAALGNGGNIYRPYVVSKVINNEGQVVESFGPQLVRSRPVDPKHLQLIRDALNDVANAPGGTAYAFARTPEKLISGKSGTVQVISMSKDELFSNCYAMPFERRHHAWFVGYAPKENPEIVVSVFAMHECGGSRAASPVVKAVVERWWKKKQEDEMQKGPQPAAVAR